MAKNVLFLIHGVGKQGEDWATQKDGAVLALQKVSEQYPFFKGENLNDIIDLVPIRYDDIFDRILGHWANLAEGIKAKAGAVGPDAVKTALELLSEADNDKNFFLTHGGDVILYRGFKLFAQRVQLRVISKIVETIAQKNRDSSSTSVRFNVLAHSLGTTVAHDALHLLGTENWLKQGYQFNEDKTVADSEKETFDSSLESMRARKVRNHPFSPEEFRFDSVFMVSNTSPLLYTTQESPYQSIVRPGTDGHDSSYCRYYYNVDHTFDPISKVKRFQVPSEWTNFEGALKIENLNHFHAKNIHALSHYLLHPKLHLHILTRLVNGFTPGDQEMAVLKNFPRFGGEFEAMETRLEGVLQKAKQARSFEQFLAVLKEMLAIVRD
jgi:hypothetical protein